jgi:hypothetical protein
VQFKGTPEVIAAQGSGNQWVQHFEPRPGETLTVTVTRPVAIEGPTFAFENVRHALTPGRRSTDTQLEIDYRSTQGGRHAIELPEGARLRQVIADGTPLVIRDQDGRLELPLQPGAHNLKIEWQTDTGASFATRPGAVKLGAPASNVATTIEVPAGRWLLAVGGGGVGPAILYWAELAVFVALALLLGRLTRSPLATHEWLLVGLGLSTFSWSVLLLFAVWVFAFDWRSRWKAEVAPSVFNATQIALALLTLVALGSLLAAIPNGLLATPDMHVTGSASHAGHLEWFMTGLLTRCRASGDLDLNLVLQGGNARLGPVVELCGRALGSLGVGRLRRQKALAAHRCDQSIPPRKCTAAADGRVIAAKKNPACAGCLVARDALCSFYARSFSWRPLIKCTNTRLPACSLSRFRSSPAVLSLPIGWCPPDQPPFIGGTSHE